MCTRYITPEELDIERHWMIGRRNSLRWTKAEIFPSRPGPFIRAARDVTEFEREPVIGQFGLIPWFATSHGVTSRKPACASVGL